MMIISTHKVKILQKLPIPYEFKKTITTEGISIYYKDYLPQLTLDLSSSLYREINLKKDCTILLQINNRFYYCPLFEELYKKAKTTMDRNLTEFNTTLYYTENMLSINLGYNYRTTDIKEIVFT